MVKCILFVILSCGSKQQSTLNAAHLGMALMDTATTQRQAYFYWDGVKRTYTVKEINPITRPFQSHGKPLAYVSTVAGVVGVEALAYRMKQSNNRVIKRLWWVPQVMLVGASSWGTYVNVSRFSREMGRGPVVRWPI